MNWTVIPEEEYEIKREGDQYLGIVYTEHFSHWKAKWVGILKMVKKGPIQEFRKCVAKDIEIIFRTMTSVYV